MPEAMTETPCLPPQVPPVLRMEENALRRWLNGDPGGFLEICAPDVGYFDPFLEQRLDGLDALARYYDGLRGKIHADRYEILHPRVQHSGDIAVLTFNFVSYGRKEDALRWHCSEVYRCDAPGWRLIHTHWSFCRC